MLEMCSNRLDILPTYEIHIHAHVSDLAYSHMTLTPTYISVIYIIAQLTNNDFGDQIADFE